LCAYCINNNSVMYMIPIDLYLLSDCLDIIGCCDYVNVVATWRESCYCQS